jgi:hypothetical protein
VKDHEIPTKEGVCDKIDILVIKDFGVDVSKVQGIDED